MRSLVYAAAIVVLTLGAISIGRFHAVEAQVRDLENPQPEVEAICTPAPSGIVAWYRGEDNGLDVFDLNDGTLQNGATYTTGKVGRAFDLDGSNDYITIPDSPAVRPANALTVEGWFKFDTLIPAPGENANHLVAKPLGTQFGDSYVLWISDIGHLRGGICDSTTTCDFVDSGFTVQINTWYHVAMTFDDAANSLRIFVDGAQVSQATTNKSIVYDSHPLVIGADIENETVQFFHDGQADEVTVYDRALSLAELQSIYNANSGGKCLYCTPAPVGMASWYQAENDTNDVRSRINGTPQGGIGYAPGKIGQAFNFDGVDDSVELGNGIASHNFSLSMWVRPGATQVQYADIVDNNHSKFQNWVIQQDASNTNLYAFSGTPTFPLAPDVWQHLVVTHDSSDNSRAYVDGVLVASGTHAITYNGTQFLRLGRWGGFNPDQGGNRYWNGQIDEFTIFDRPLTPIEVRNLYQAGGNGMCRPTATTPPSGVVGWWGGDGDALDISGNGNNGSMQNGALFAVDKVGQGFAFDGVDDHVLVPANSTLNVGAGGGLTVEAWVNPANSDQQPFFEWNGGGPDLGNLGAHLWMSVPGSGDVTNNMHGNLVDINNISHVIRAPGVIVPGQWQHVALTYDKGFGNAVIYFNGVAVATSNLGTFTPRTFSNLYLGHRPGSVFLNGKLDEPAVYNRVLTPTEIISIFNTGIGGKLKTVNSAGEPSGNKVGDVTLTLQNLTTPGITQEIPLDPAQLAPLPNGMTSLGLTYDVDTSAVFAGNVDLCFNVPALLAMPAASLRVLHLENGAWIDRTAGGATHSALCTIGVISLSPFAIAGSTAATPTPTATPTSTTTPTATPTVTLTPTPTPLPTSDYCTPALVGLVSSWSGEGNAIDARSRNDGILQGGTGYAAGKVGQAFSFDGVDDSVDLGTGIATQIFSLSMWVKPGATQVQYAEIVDNNHTDFQNWAIQQDSNNTNMYAFTGTPYFPLAANVWQHLVVTHDSANNSRAYVDGVLVASGVYAFTYNGTQFLRLGRWGNSLGLPSNRNWNGQLDEFATFDRTLTPIEVRNMFQTGGNGMCHPTATTPPGGVAGWWGGDGDAVDISGNGNNGTMQHAAKYGVGKVGQAFSLNGAGDYVEIPDSAVLKPANITLEAWVNFASLDSTVIGNVPGTQRLIHKQNERSGAQGTFASYELVKSRAAGLDKMYSCINTNSGNQVCVESTTVIVAGQWYHVAATYDAQALKIYVNGVLDGTVATTQPLEYANKPVLLGRTNDSAWDGHLNGTLDEPTVYSRALSQPEIQSIVNAGLSGKLKTVNSGSGPFSLWKGEANANDSIGTNQGSANNGTTYTAGITGQSFSFDGADDEVSVPDAANLNFGTNSPMSIELWAYRTSTGVVQHLIGKRPGCTVDLPNFQIAYANSQVLFGSGSGNEVGSGIDLPLNTWTHIAATFDGTTNRIYMDGIFAASAPGTHGPATSAPLRIGTSGTCSTVGESFGGRLDEVAMYSRALSANEILRDYQSQNNSGNKVGDVTVTFQNLTTPGITQEIPLDPTLFAPLPNGMTSLGLTYDIDTSAGFTGNADLCFSVPALLSTAAGNLRILHLENGAWVDRTVGGATHAALCTTGVTSLSPFAIASFTAATPTPTATPTATPTNTPTATPTNTPTATPTATPTPLITIAATPPLDFGAVSLDGISSTQTTSITGANLTNDISCAAPPNFWHVSSDGTTWGTNTTFSQTGGSASGTLYIRLVPLQGASHSGNIVCSSVGATPKTLLVQATGITTYYRGGTIDWNKNGTSNTVMFTVKAAFRRSEFGTVGIGDLVDPGSDFEFGDGTTFEDVRLLVSSVDTFNSTIYGTLQTAGGGAITHTYPADGTYTAFWRGGRRLDTASNFSSNDWRSETTITIGVGSGGASGRSSITTIVPTLYFPDNNLNQFSIPATSFDGYSTTFPTGTQVDFVTTTTNPAGPMLPPGASVASGTGIVTWDTTNANQPSIVSGQQYFFAVMLDNGHGVLAPVEVMFVVTPAANLVLDTTSFSFGTVTVGTSSPAQTRTISGSNLLADITCASTAGFEISNDGSFWTSSAVFPRFGGNASGTLSTRFSPTSTGATGGQIQCSTTGAVAKTFNVDGAGVAPTPTPTNTPTATPTSTPTATPTATPTPNPSPTACATPGSLDLSFDGDGKVITQIGSFESYARSVAIQSDGKIVTAGYGFGTGANFAVARYNTDGSLDTSFDGDGKVITPIRTFDDEAYAVAIQSDGKIVAAGYSSNGQTYDFALVRYNANGSLDTSFDGDGIVITPVGISNDVAYSVTIQSDGKIVAAGDSSLSLAVVRYNANGSLDTSFDGDGKVVTAIANDAQAESVAIQSDGKIVAAGHSFGSNSDFTIVRYNTNGSLDTSFDFDGIAITPVSLTFNDQARSVAIQSDGKLVTAGFSFSGNTDTFALVRYNSDGSLDNTFDGDGKLVTHVDLFLENRAEAVAIQSDGKIVAAGHVYFSSTDVDFAMARYNTDGSLDTSFDLDGKLRTPISGGFDVAESIVIQSDGKIVAAGYADYSDFALVRYNGAQCGSPTATPTATPTSTSTATPTPLPPRQTNTTVTSSLNPSTFGVPITFTATVTSGQPGVIPTGSVTFSVGSTNVNVPLDVNGSASHTVSATFFSAGQYAIVARYNGSTFYDPSSGFLPQTVNRADLNFEMIRPADGDYIVLGQGPGNIEWRIISPAYSIAAQDTGVMGFTGPGAPFTLLTLTRVSTQFAFFGDYLAPDNFWHPFYAGYNQRIVFANGAGGSFTNFNRTERVVTVTIAVSYRGNIYLPPNRGESPAITAATIELIGTNGYTTTTNANGEYEFVGVFTGEHRIRPSMPGVVFEPETIFVPEYTRSVPAGNFTTFPADAIPRKVRVGNSGVTPGQNLSLPVVIESLGNERTVSFSMNYDINPFANNPTATCGASVPGCAISYDNSMPGKLGVTVTTAAPIAAGQVEIARVNLSSLSTNQSNSPITFGDMPTARVIKNVANDTLAAEYVNGLIVFANGLEGDAAPRGAADGEVLPNDVVLARQFVAGSLVANSTSNEFQRVDTAPASTKGDGILDATDIIKTRRYAAGLDPVQAVGGPIFQQAPVALSTERSVAITDIGRGLMVTSAKGDPGKQVNVAVELSGNETEAAASFTLEFDRNKLTNPRVALADGMPIGTVLTVSDRNAENGRIGILVDGSGLSGGVRSARLVTVTFDVTDDATGEAATRLTDSIVRRSMSDAEGMSLPAAFLDGAIVISGSEKPVDEAPLSLSKAFADLRRILIVFRPPVLTRSAAFLYQRA